MSLLALLAIPAALVTQDPSCPALLDSLHARVVADYAGYHLEVAGTPRQVLHDRMLVGLRRRAASVAGDACFDVLHDYLAWFDDPHLFIFQSWRLDSAETRRRMATVPRVAIDTAAVRRALVGRGASADPIEGFWYDGTMEMAVVPDPEGHAGRFVAVVTTSDTATLPPGSVRAVFDRRADGRYDTELRWPTLAVTHPPVTHASRRHAAAALAGDVGQALSGPGSRAGPARSGRRAPGDAHLA